MPAGVHGTGAAVLVALLTVVVILGVPVLVLLPLLSQLDLLLVLLRELGLGLHELLLLPRLPLLLLLDQLVPLLYGLLSASLAIGDLVLARLDTVDKPLVQLGHVHAALGLNLFTVDTIKVFLDKVDCLVLLEGPLPSAVWCVADHLIDEGLI